MSVKISDDFNGDPRGKRGVFTFENNDSRAVYIAEGNYDEIVETLPHGDWTLIANSSQ